MKGKRGRILWIVAGVSAACVVAMFLLVVGVVLVCDPSFGNATTYAAGYSEAKFKQVKVGMTIAEVTHMLGEPLSIEGSHQGHSFVEVDPIADPDWQKTLFSPGSPAKLGKGGEPIVVASFDYSEPEKPNYDFYMRRVCFGTDGRVTGTIAMHCELF